MSMQDGFKILRAFEKSNAGLRGRMLFILMLAAVPGIVVAVFLTVQQLREETQQIENSVNRLAALGAAQHESVIANARVLLKAVVEAQRLDTVADADCESYLKDWSKQFTYFTSLTLFDLKGQAVCNSVGGELQYSARDKRWFLEAISKRTFTLSDYQSGRNGAPLLVAALPVEDKKTQVIGVIALGISLNWLKFLAGTVALPPKATITVLGPEGRRLTHYDGNSFDSKTTKTQPSDDVSARIYSLKKGTMRGEDLSTVTRVYGFRATKLGGLVVIVGLPQFVEYFEWSNALFENLVSPLVVLFLALGAAAWASEALVVRHVRSMIGTANEIATGNLQARSEVDYDEHELGKLAMALDTMAEEIEQQQTELKAQSEESLLIAREMQHRIGNTLTLARIIATQSLKHSASDEEFIETFGKRIQALSVSNQSLLQGNWQSADLEQLLSETLSIHMGEPTKQVDMNGPQVELGPRAVLAITLSIHELTTNSIKYGALSAPDGRVTLHWQREIDLNKNALSITWRETGYSPDASPKSEGFGSQLIKSMVETSLRGRLKRVFTHDGMTCTITFPIASAA